MIIFYSGSSYSKLYPERESRTKKTANFMMSYYEIKNKKAGEHKRFKLFVKDRNK